MGRRKERRLAAMSAAGRRVKVDLSTEPSGDLGGSSAQEDVGGDGDLKTPAEFQSPETSSGQQLPNPLLLLEQYSDEEPDGSLKEVNSCAASKDISDHANEANNTDSDEPNSLKIEQCVNDNGTSDGHSEKIDEGSIKEINSDDFLQRQNDNTEGPVFNAAPNTEFVATGNAISGWKSVLHEESNLYYYWNIVTGETSWEVPDVLSLGVMKTSETSENNGITGAEATTSDGVKEIGLSDEGDRVRSVDYKDRNSNSNQGDGGHLSVSPTSENVSDETLSRELIKKCESLLQRLNSFEGADSHRAMKYITEIEIRLGDVKSLACHVSSSSLLPFWQHTEAQLKKLEVGLHSLMICRNGALPDEFQDKSDSLEVIVSSNGNAPSTEEVECGTAISDHEVTEPPDTSGRDAALASSTYVAKDLGGKIETDGPETGSESDHRTVLQSVEDVDMEVDVELEGIDSAYNSHPPPPPPPPPDDELYYPPPPPDDSLDASSQLAGPPLPLFPLSGDYAVSYHPVPDLQFYGQTDGSGVAASLYAQPSDLRHYYDAAAYAVGPLVDAAAYYGLQSAPETVDLHLVHPSGGSIAEAAGSGFLLNADPKAVGFAENYVKPGKSSPTDDSLNLDGNKSSKPPSKAQRKVPRAKKRAVAVISTSRTNKKVSGLVDKWKAAKEELRAEEEEEEDAYGSLEKKRQREIEEWRANQVATGAAKDNANFQPLGGDWRERVKKRKKVETTAEETRRTSPKDEAKRKPDLVGLAKGLPSGWQAYWDESSKQVYYGNVLTSETTWTRPKV